MLITKNTLSELTYYLSSFEKAFENVPQDKKIYKEGTTSGQIMFHTFQAVNYWFRVILLKEIYARNREEEFMKQPSGEQIKKSLTDAIEACAMLEKANMQLDFKIKPIVVGPAKFSLETANDVIIHMTSHTGEHWGELHLLKKL